MFIFLRSKNSVLNILIFKLYFQKCDFFLNLKCMLHLGNARQYFRKEKKKKGKKCKMESLL